MDSKTICIRLIKSHIGATDRQIDTLKALGLKYVHQEVKHPANPAILGMVSKIQRWVEVVK